MVETDRGRGTPVIARDSRGEAGLDSSKSEADRRSAADSTSRSKQKKHRQYPSLLTHKLGGGNRRTGSRAKHGNLFLFCGVILPVLAVGFELSTHFCAKHFFDPFPSASHVVLFLLIPLSNFMAWLAGRKDMSAHFGFMSVISGMAMGVGCLYALMFLPITPSAAMYTLFFGVGLLGLAPLLSLPCTWLGGKTVVRLASNRKTFFDAHQVEHIGHLIVLCLVVAVELPSTLTRMNLALAANPATEKQGISWLRQFGSEEVMLRACYERSGRATDILGSLYESGHPVSIEASRSIFYKVTGKPFNSVPIPASARATIQHAGLIDDPNGLNASVQDEFDLDSDIAGENVSGVARGVAIQNPALSGTVDANAAVADLKYDFTLGNSSPYDREARAKLLLPDGAVITKASITVSGKECEATILLRSLARTIYRNNVKEHKDPLLISTCGPNQVLIQCFPVQPNSSMSVHLNFAAPLTLSKDNASASLMLPAFTERNFQFDVPAHIALTANGNASSREIKIGDAHSASVQHSIEGTVEPSQLSRFASITFLRDRNVKEVTARDEVANDGSFVTARATSQTYLRPDNICILIDGSAPMQRYMPEIAAGLKSLPGSVKAEFVVVGDDVQILGDNFDAARFATAIGAIEKYHAVGGHVDDYELLSRLAKSPVVWIHGAQPINTGSGKVLSDLPLHGDHPLLYDVATVASPNEMLNNFEPTSGLFSLPRVGKLSEDLTRLFESWVDKPAQNIRFTIAAAPNAVSRGGVTSSTGVFVDTAGGGLDAASRGGVSKAIGSLAAYQRVVWANAHGDLGNALSIAGKYKLVTPVSSAVVMEFIPVKNPSPAASNKMEEPLNASALLRSFSLENIFVAQLSQLNNLSTAAGPSSSTEIMFSPNMVAKRDRQSRSSEALVEEPSSDQKFDAPKSAPDDFDSGAYGGAKNRAVDGLELKAKDKEVLITADEFEKGSAVPAAPAAARMPPHVEAPQEPGLAGATNGVIGPEQNAKLEGAPIDPRYGQSQTSSFADDSPETQIRSAFCIFFFVFASIFAAFKLIRALQLHRSTK